MCDLKVWKSVKVIVVTLSLPQMIKNSVKVFLAEEPSRFVDEIREKLYNAQGLMVSPEASNLELTARLNLT